MDIFPINYSQFELHANGRLEVLMKHIPCGVSEVFLVEPHMHELLTWCDNHVCVDVPGRRTVISEVGLEQAPFASSFTKNPSERGKDD